MVLGQLASELVSEQHNDVVRIRHRRIGSCMSTMAINGGVPVACSRDDPGQGSDVAKGRRTRLRAVIPWFIYKIITLLCDR